MIYTSKIFKILQNNSVSLNLTHGVIIPVQVHGPASQHVSNSTMMVSTPNTSVLSQQVVVEDHWDDYKKEALREGKCLSIGIQVLRFQVLNYINIFAHC